MSGLAAFMNPTYTEKTAEVFVSDRFLDDDGKPVPFILKALSQEVLESIAKRSQKIQEVDGHKVKALDKPLHLSRCIVESCVQPDFKNLELCHKFGTEDPSELPRKMLFVGEYEKLARAFLDLNGLSDDSPEYGEITKK
jgi:hypothetical protein